MIGGSPTLIPNKWIEIIKKTLSDSIKPGFIILFGSYAKNNARSSSNLDIAYFTEEKVTDYNRFIIAQQLANQLKKEVDLVDIKRIDIVFAAQIFSTGVLIYCKDKNEFIKQRMKALSMYTTLNEQRSNLLKEIDERGYIYEE